MLCLKLAMLALCLSQLSFDWLLLAWFLMKWWSCMEGCFLHWKYFWVVFFFLPSIRKRFGLVCHSCEITTQKCYVALPRFIYLYIFEWWELVSILWALGVPLRDKDAQSTLDHNPQGSRPATAPRHPVSYPGVTKRLKISALFDIIEIKEYGNNCKLSIQSLLTHHSFTDTHEHTLCNHFQFLLGHFISLCGCFSPIYAELKCSAMLTENVVNTRDEEKLLIPV